MRLITTTKKRQTPCLPKWMREIADEIPHMTLNELELMRKFLKIRIEQQNPEKP